MGINVPGAGVVNGTTLTGSQAMREYSSTYGFLAANGAGNIAKIFQYDTIAAADGDSRQGRPDYQCRVTGKFCGSESAILRGNLHLRVPERGLQFRRLRVESAPLHRAGVPDEFYLGQSDAAKRSGQWWNAAIAIQKLEPGRDSGRPEILSWKASGTYNFPLGVGRKYLNSKTGVSGVMTNLLGNWQTGAILTVNSGSYLNFSCSGDPLGGSNNCSSVGALPGNPGHVIKGGNGVTYFSNAAFAQVTDPYCATLTTSKICRAAVRTRR